MFKNARIKLTMSYLVILMAVSGMFSVFIYRVMVSELDRFEESQRLRLERRMRDQMMFPFAPDTPMMLVDPELIEETRNRILFRLIFVNGGILVIAGALAYWLAGRTLGPIAEMVEEQHRFVSDASHELKTPITAIKTAIEVYLLDKKHTLKEANSLIKESLGDIDRLGKLTESMLRLSQISSQQHRAVFAPADIASIMSEAVKRIKPFAQKKKITITVNQTAGTVNGSADSLTDLLVILLDNAVKYSPAGREVAVGTVKKDNSFLITVKDEGVGIAPEEKRHIFDRFYRADAARKSGGYGLGLAIAKKIVTEHKGTISAESASGKGTTFTVRLPAAR